MYSLASDNFEKNLSTQLKMSYVCESLEFLKLYAEYFELNELIFKHVALNGDLNNMKWLKENNCPWDEFTFSAASENGNLTNMKWLKKNNYPSDGWTSINADKNGNLKNIKWLKENFIYLD
jgi:hypothetical protein